MVKKTRITLSNGLPLVVVEIPDSKSLVTSFWTKAGGRLDPEDKPGMSHFMEHLLIKKTKKYPTDAKLAEVLERVGAFKNGNTGKDSMNLNISSSAKNLDVTIPVLSEMVFNPYIDKEGFEAERKVIFQEQARRHSLPDDLVWEVWFKLFFNPSVMTNSVMGDKESLGRISLSDVQDYWQKHSREDFNMLFISGGVNTSQVAKLAETYFGKYPLVHTEAKNFDFMGKEKILIENKDLPRANMLMSFRIPGGEVYDDFYSLLALRGILALGWSSRAYQRLRIKESLIYGFGSRLIRYCDTGAFAFLTASDKKNFPKMLSVFCEEVVKIRDRGVTEKELELAKGYIEGMTLSDVETSWDYCDWYALEELYHPDKVDSPEERVQKIKRVSKDDVERVAKKYLTNTNWNLAVVGNVKMQDLRVEL